ncbi:MAG: SET domain-containing protein [Patescibacteria group bacterium]
MNKIQRKILDRLKNTYCRLKPSKIKGVGVFAVRNIPKGVKLFTGITNHRWHQFKLAELNRLDPAVLKMIDDFFVIEKDQTVYIPESALNAMDISFFVNNSKKPNAKTINKGDNFLTFVSTRKIKKGEEITTSYADYDYKYK